MIKELYNVYVYTDPSAIYDENFNILPYTNIFAKWRSYFPNITPVDVKTMKVAKRFDGNINYCCALPYHGCYVYGHILDVTQSLYDFKHINDSILVTLTPTGHIPSLYKNHFNIYGYYNMEELSHKSLYFFKKLIVSLDETPPAMINSIKLQWIKNGYFDSIISKTDILKNKERTKLFLTRKYDRKIKNQKEIWDYLEKLGFTILDGYSYNEDLKMHMDLFGRSIIVIGVHGSLFRNSIFCLYNDVTFHEFCPINRVCTSIKTMSEDCGVVNYTQHLIDSDKSYDIELDIEFIKQIIKDNI